MVGIVSEDFEAGDEQMMLERLVNSQRCQPAESLEEWWSCEQAEHGMVSTCPPYWDTDNDDDGPKPSELYGQFTWKLENFSTISKREMRSDPFEAGGYKWNVLIYPHGCDVCNHLSLFLCVADHEKLLPGWSHFAQFTIAVVNKDTKKSKYSDTLHRFWKKEHDWGWKKFMELSKVLDGFIVADTLVIKAQVQVIREKACRPFRCLDYRYRRDLVHTYLPNVEQICRRFVEERRGKLSKLIEDKIRWSSFRVFWLGIDQNARRRMSRDKTDAILRVVVKHFFIEKEVTSTLVMDSLYSGLKALEYQSKNMKGSSELSEMDSAVTPMIHIEKDMFVLADDVLPLLERAASAPLPHQILAPKEDKGLQNRTKDGSFGKINKDSIERDERFLTELGRRTVEIFILTHIFSRIEIAYQEVVALKRQEELIREEEAWHAENELKARLAASEKEKRSKKKQAKKRNSQKGKVRGRSQNTDSTLHDKHQPDDPSVEKALEDFCSKEIQLLEKLATLEGVSSVSDAADEFMGTVQPDLEDGDTSTINWDTDTLESAPTSETSGSRMQNGQIERRSPSVVDDSSSTCSTDSVPFVVISGRYKGNSMRNGKSQTSPERGKNQRNKKMREQSGSIHGGHNLPSYTAANSDGLCSITGTSSANPPEPDDYVLLSKDHIQLLEKHLVEKEEVVTLQKKLNIKDQSDVDRPSKSAVAEPSSSSATPGTKSCAISQQPRQTSEMKADAGTATTAIAEPVSSIEALSSSPTQTDKSVPHSPKSPKSFSKSESQRQITPERSIAGSQVTAVSRPSSAPLSPGPRPTAPVVSTVRTLPLLSRSTSAAGRLGSDPSPSAQSYIPRSYRNAIIGKTSMGSTPAGQSQPSLRSSSQDAAYTQSSSSALSPQAYVRKDQSSAMPSLTFGSVKPGGVFHSQNHYFPSFTRNVNDDARLNTNDELRQKQYSNGGPLSGSGRPPILVMSEEFPHLDIINDLLDEEQNIVNAANIHHQQYPYQPQSLCRQYSFPGSMADIGSSSPSLPFDHTEQYYDNGFTTFYGSSNGPLDGMRDAHFQQADLAAFNSSSQMDGLIQNHWPYDYKLAGITDLSMLNFENTYTNGYPYQGTDYSNLACGVNGYAMYHPGNGF